MFSSLRLERFKNFKDAELTLGPFTILIGANASGKSNIRDAFRFLHGIARGYSLPEIIGEKYGEGGETVWTGIRGGAREITFSGERSFALTAQTHEESKELRYRIEVEIDKSKSELRVASEKFGVADNYDYFESSGNKKNGDLKVKFYHLQESIADLRSELTGATGLTPSITELRKLQSAHEILNLPKHFPFLASVASESNFLNFWDEASDWIFTNRRDVLGAIKTYRFMRFFDWSLDAIRQPSLAGQDVLSDNGRNLSSVLYAICQDAQSKQNLLSWIQELTPMDAVDFRFSTDPSGRILATLVERSKQKISLASASDGTLRFLAFIAGFLGPNRGSFYFFEELENGVHPTRLSLLLDLIENQVKNKNIQVVATTHSPELLGRLSKQSLEHASLVYRLPDEPDARIIRVLDLPHAKGLIKKQRVGHLFSSGWFERTALFMQPDEDRAVPARPARKRARERVK